MRNIFDTGTAIINKKTTTTTTKKKYNSITNTKKTIATRYNFISLSKKQAFWFCTFHLYSLLIMHNNNNNTFY